VFIALPEALARLE